MKLVVKGKLVLEAEQRDQIRATIVRMNAAANWLGAEAFAAREASKYRLQRAHYRGLRERLGLSAQMAVRTIAKV